MNCGGGGTSLFVQDRFREDGAGQYRFEARRCDVPTEEREECACGVAAEGAKRVV